MSFEDRAKRSRGARFPVVARRSRTVVKGRWRKKSKNGTLKSAATPAHRRTLHDCADFWLAPPFIFHQGELVPLFRAFSSAAPRPALARRAFSHEALLPAPASPAFSTSPPVSSSGALGEERQREAEGRAAARLARDRDAPAVRLYDPLRAL